MRLVLVVLLASCAYEGLTTPAPIPPPPAPRSPDCVADFRAVRDAPAQPFEAQVARVEGLGARFVAMRDRLPARHAKLCHDEIAALTSKLARRHHHHAANGEPARFPFAERLYVVYLSRFRDASEFAANQFYYAELLWSIAERTDNQDRATRWERAARAYGDVIVNRSVEPKLAKEAAYAATLSWKNVVDFGPHTEPSLADPPRPLAISEPEQQLLAAMATYGGLIKDPRDDELATMAFMAGRIYLRYDHLDEAIARFAYLIDQHPAHELVPNAELVLRSARLRRLKM